ncbi:hypothetical protein [Streptomyces sp. NBC_00859]|uniref:hypothetical protein n=1 Tax=Streptomyces sp. NBC_00859 TaxID=2903682 RepID=UPI00386FF1C8|nr:hypothetical protein OG584_09760 [Streptomyces sp. NBC_00859]
MRGDEAQLSTTEGDDFRERRGGRHAAPRKSLLTKLHIPASKAIALAAMPTAVFVGMGLTPKLAMADDHGDVPFAAGPCVSRSDEPSESAKPSDSPSPSASASDDASGDKAKKDDKSADPSDTPAPSATPSAGATGSGKKAGSTGSSASDTAGLAAPSSSPSPSATKSKNPLDPLGVGDALKNLFDPDKDKDSASPSPDPSSSASSGKTAAEKEAAEKKAAEKKAADKKAAEKKAADDSAAKKAGQVTGAAKSTADKTAEKIREAAAEAGKTVKDLPADAKGLDPKKDTAIPDGAKPSYPCPTADPKALAAADLEQGIPALPDDPWTLKSSMLTLNGLDYKGIVEVKTGSGKIKKVLKFTSSSLDIKDLHQMTVGPNGSTGHVKAASGSTSTIRDGEVTMYTESLKGNLFGLIPITFSPDTPPPINVPFAFFTNVTVKQAGQFGGTLHVPGLQNYFTGA